jgi:hypothetical protein
MNQPALRKPPAAQPANTPNSQESSSLSPRRKNPWLLAVSALMLTLWLVFLAVLAFRG